MAYHDAEQFGGGPERWLQAWRPGVGSPQSGRQLSMTQKRIMRSLQRAVECRVAIGFAFRAVVTLMVSASAAMAQTGGGATLVGTVKDATGAVVAQAKVTVVNTATAFVTETSTTADGGYYVP